VDAQAGLDPCWSQTHCVGFLMMQLKYGFSLHKIEIRKINYKVEMVEK
jgi:hypothetical protein